MVYYNRKIYDKIKTDNARTRDVMKFWIKDVNIFNNFLSSKMNKIIDNSIYINFLNKI